MSRVNEAVSEVLSARIAEDLKDPRIGFVTVTAVETSPDLRHARVYVSVLGDEAEREDSLAGLAASHGLLQAQVADELRMKRTPTLEFVHDDTVDRGMRIARAASSARGARRVSMLHRDRRGRWPSSAQAREAAAHHAREPRRRRARARCSAMHWILEQLGKDSLMYMSPDEFPLPYEYRDMDFDGLVGAPPEDLDERTVVFLDCGNIDRMPVDFLQRDGLHILNIDHHHDNTRFGTVNLVGADGVVHRRDRVRRWPRSWAPRSRRTIADALYVGLVTDTGRFMYENTTPEAHHMAAELIEAGVDAARGLPAPVRGPAVPPAAAARARAGAASQRYDDGAITLASSPASDFNETDALETDSEGIVDHLRAVEDTAVAVLVRELLADDRAGCAR